MSARSAILRRSLLVTAVLSLVCSAVASALPGEPVRAEDEAEAAIDRVRQGEIYLILRGGSPVRSNELCNHLWKVAGSLAKLDWTPPSVRIRVVVQESEGIERED
jgi:hypothetical protein